MEVIIALVALGVIAFALIAMLQNKSGATSAEFSYVKRPRLLSNAERSFFGILVQAVGEHGAVLPKVRVADVLAPKKGSDKSTWQKAFNRISGKHFDFIICDPSSLTPLVAVELDDLSHKGKAALKRDSVKNSVSESAGFPLVRVKVARSYVVADIQQMLSGHISSMDIQPYKSPVQVAKSKSATVSGHVQEANSPSCPKCNSRMVRREIKKGRNTGKKFWGCTQFPACRGVLLTDT